MLTQSGEITETDTETLPVFQCDHCIVTRDIMGAPFEVALTFCLDEKGRPFDPASPDTDLSK